MNHLSQTKQRNLLKIISAVAILSIAAACTTGGSEKRSPVNSSTPGKTSFSPPPSTEQIAKEKEVSSGRAVKTGNGGGEEPSSEATERFVDVGDGTVTDTQSGLTWTKDANCFDKTTWRESFTACENLASGQCGLNDGSTTGDWRMPNKRELESLVDRSRRFPSLPEGHPLMNIESTYYWTSTDCAWDDRYVWTVHMGLGGGINGKKTNRFCVWCVKDKE